MNTASVASAKVKSARAFTLLEVMLAMAIFAVVLAAIYASWTGILRASKVATDSAATAQRQRMAIQVVQEALTTAQLYVANVGYYGFTNEAKFGGSSSLSFVARLPQAFPRSGKFGEFEVRRVTFSVETDADRHNMLVLRQNPILMEMDEDERVHPVVLARDVKLFKSEYWDPTKSDWSDEWTDTNTLPQLVRVSFQLGYGTGGSALAGDLITRVIGIPTTGVQPGWQTPGVTRTTTGAGGGGGAGGGTKTGGAGSGGGSGGIGSGGAGSGGMGSGGGHSVGIGGGSGGIGITR